jgi:general secretion pathway protein K
MLLRERSGMALVLALLAVSFLIAVTVQLGSTVNWQMQAAANQGSVVRLDAMLLSGLHVAQAALLADQQDNQHDAAFDRWGSLDKEALAKLFPEGGLNIEITDLSGLIQVNALVLSKEEKKQQDQDNSTLKSGQKKKDKEAAQRGLWRRFLPLAGVDDEQVESLLDCLADWMDEDSEERDQGAETYEGYTPANAEILLVDDMLLIKGWKDVLPQFVGNLSAAGREGKININTAPDVVLQALHEDMTAELAAAMIEFRQDEGNKEKLAQPDWYKTLPDFPGDIAFDQDIVTTSSSFFKVSVTAEVSGLRRKGEGVIYRKKNQEQTLLWWKTE